MKYLFELVSKSADSFDKSIQDLILIEEMTELAKGAEGVVKMTSALKKS